MITKIQCAYMVENGFRVINPTEADFYCTYKGHCPSKIDSPYMNKCLYELLKNGNTSSNLLRRLQRRLEVQELKRGFLK